MGLSNVGLTSYVSEVVYIRDISQLMRTCLNKWDMSRAVQTNNVNLEITNSKLGPCDQLVNSEYFKNKIIYNFWFYRNYWTKSNCWINISRAVRSIESSSSSLHHWLRRQTIAGYECAIALDSKRLTVSLIERIKKKKTKEGKRKFDCWTSWSSCWICTKLT